MWETDTVLFRPTLHPLWPVTTTKRWASLQCLRFVHLFGHRCDLWQINEVFSSKVAVTCDRRVGRNSHGTAMRSAEYDIHGDSGSANRKPAADSSRGKCWSPLLQYSGLRVMKTTELQWWRTKTTRCAVKVVNVCCYLCCTTTVLEQLEYLQEDGWCFARQKLVL
jgi:hypothetical protein